VALLERLNLRILGKRCCGESGLGLTSKYRILLSTRSFNDVRRALLYRSLQSYVTVFLKVRFRLGVKLRLSTYVAQCKR
jgi:hypothetical protein